MSNELSLFIWLTEAEYNGASFNGPNLRKTLQALTLAQAASPDTLEGYTVWGVVLHLAYWKRQAARELGAAALPPFPYEEADFPALPATQDEAAWQQALATLDAAHGAYIAALSAFPVEKLEDKMPWGFTYGQAVAWMATHDTYHTAMIRNMGVPALAGGDHVGESA